MKKFCSNCGNQLELSQRNCSQCGEINPFFVAAFTILSDQTDALEKLKLEKEKIEKELQEKLLAQLEFERQEQIRKEQEEAEKIRVKQLLAAKKEAERLEQERIEELIKREREKLEKELEEKLQARLTAEREQQLMREQEEAHKFKASELEIARREAERIELLLNQEKEKLARELQQQLESQLMAEREQRLKQEEAEKIRLQKLAADQMIAEQEKMEAALQSEILLVKQTSQEYQKQTIDWVNGVREELQQIEVENKKLKQEVENLHRILPDKTEAYSAPLAAEPSIAEARFERKALSAIIGFVFLIGAGLVLFYMINWQTSKQASVAKEPAKSISAKEESSNSDVKEYIPVVSPEVSNEKKADLTAIAQPDKISKSTLEEEPEVKSEIMKKPSSSRISVISAQTIAADMVGQKVSGCDILIRSIEEVSSVSGLKLIDKLPSGQLKYKFSAIITQNKQTYRTSPYIYYQTNGTFVKLDGTNCE